ncbi:hypothetical protein BASA81_001107 [Batrachochytrium salamandrivorans]|nr:hypothetical protein BASA81_001107 [Batrachochytrium salamandrivorans]
MSFTSGKKDKGAITQVREKFKKAEDVKIHEDTLPEDLLDGVVLCKLMMQIEGSGVTKYHALKRGNAKMDAFKSRENCVRFTNACKLIGLPVTFGYDDLHQGDLGVIASTLVYLAHACAMRNVGVEEMHPELKRRLGLVTKERKQDQDLAGLDVDKDELLEKFEELRVFLPDVVKSDVELDGMEVQDLLVELGQVESARVSLVDKLTKANSLAKAKELESLKLDSNLAKALQLDYSFVGVDFRFLKGLFSLEQVGKMTVREVENKLITPMLASKHSSGMQSLATILLHEIEPNVGIKADVVVSVDADMEWIAMLSALEETVEATDFVSASGRTKVWLEQVCMAPNLLKGDEMKREEEMRKVIDKIGRVNLILHPFDKPTVATKSWNVFQVVCAVANKKPVFASIAKSESERFMKDVFAGLVGLKSFQTIFWSLNVEKTTSDGMDNGQAIRVTKLVRQQDQASPNQTRVNDAFTVPIRNWILHQLKISPMEKKTGSEQSNLYMTRAAFHQSIGQPDEARNFYEKVIAVHKDLYPSEKNAQTASAMSNMSSTLRDLGEFDSAVLVCTKALEIREELFGEDHPSTMVSRAWLADILLASGNFSQALPILERVLVDHERVGSADLEISSAMNNLASAYRELGQIDQARTLFEQVLIKTEKTAGKTSPLYSAALTNCALTMEAQKDYKNALVMHEESLVLKQKTLGPDHPDVALSMHNLGVCLLRNDKKLNRDRAVGLGNSAIAIWEKAYGSKHPTVIEAKQDWEGFNKPKTSKAS